MHGRRRSVLHVTAVRTILVTAPWKGDPFWAPNLEWWRTAALIEVQTDQGITGLGETVMGYFAGEVVPPLVEYYARLLTDRDLRLDPSEPERCFDELYQRSLWWGRVGLALSVLSGIEMALWDIAGKAADKPVHALLGGAAHDRLPLYASGGTGSWPVQKTVDQAKRYVDLGFRGLKLGTGMFDRPGTTTTARQPAPYGLWNATTTAGRIGDEREKFEALRTAVGPDIEIATDSHAVQIRGPWTRRDALAIAQAIEDFDLLFYEEPLRYDDPEGYAELRQRTRIPIAGGECLTGIGEFREWFRKGALDIAQPDATHVGGIGPCLAVAKEAQAHHADLIVHTGAAIGPGLMANLHVAFASPNAHFVEYALAPDNVRAEMLAEPVRVTDGYATLPTAPGLGVELRPDFIEKYPFRPGIVEYA
jgi:L-alanine-DL-glutamate epimerase-like enolase superfamily enzyme